MHSSELLCGLDFVREAHGLLIEIINLKDATFMVKYYIDWKTIIAI